MLHFLLQGAKNHTGPACICSHPLNSSAATDLDLLINAAAREALNMLQFANEYIQNYTKNS
jgi:hypothetical protein